MSLALLEYEFRLGRRSIIGWGIIVVLWVALTAWYWSILEESTLEELQRLLEQSPEWFVRFFAKGTPLALTYTVFYIFDYYVLVYVILLGAYAAYAGAGAVVDDVLGRTGGLTLATPIGRTRVMLARLATLTLIITMITLVSLTTSIALQLTLVGGGELGWLLKLHTIGIPYLVACTTLGLLVGSALPASIAKQVAAGLILAMYTIETATKGTGAEGLSLLTITHYYPALEIAVNNTTPVTSIVTLVAITAILIAISATIYNRKDLPV